MYCPRLNHFVRLNKNGSIGKCGHMNTSMGFESVDQLEKSEWLQKIKNKMANDEWPDECVRCKQTEEINQDSIRIKSIERHKVLQPFKDDYLVIGGVLDNICNSACQTCNSGLSTKIGSLESKDYPRIDNFVRFWELPQNRILEIDVNGGEPTASKNYKKILSRLPVNTRIVRMNTNGSRMIPELEAILKKRIMVIVTLSLDGVGDTHDYVRWPIKWKHYVKSVKAYKDLQKQYPLLRLNTWTTVSSLNVANFSSILDFVTEQNLEHSWALLHEPTAYDPRFKNSFTMAAKEKLQKSSYKVCQDLANAIATRENNDQQLNLLIKKQDFLRKIDIKNYLNF